MPEFIKLNQTNANTHKQLFGLGKVETVDISSLHPMFEFVGNLLG
jgi:hypothetical protein